MKIYLRRISLSTSAATKDSTSLLSYFFVSFQTEYRSYSSKTMFLGCDHHPSHSQCCSSCFQGIGLRDSGLRCSAASRVITPPTCFRPVQGRWGLFIEIWGVNVARNRHESNSSFDPAHFLSNLVRALTNRKKNTVGERRQILCLLRFISSYFG
jgi:hypothetical protein